MRIIFKISIVILVNTIILAAELSPMKISTSIAPQAFFVKQIGGDLVSVDYLIPVAASPATYSPTPRQLVNLLSSSIYVRVGHPNFIFESVHIDPLLANSDNIAVITMWNPDEMEISWSHTTVDAESEYSNSGGLTDPHIWISPNTVRLAVSEIADQLMQIDPANKEIYQNNSDLFMKKINQLDQDIQKLLKNFEFRKFMVYHPVWGYFARYYNLEQIAIELDGKEPSPTQLIKMIKLAKANNIKVIFVQQGFSRRSARIIAQETAGEVVELNPLAYDWLKNMRLVAQVFEKVLNNE